MNTSKVHAHYGPGQFQSIALDGKEIEVLAKNPAALREIGLGLDESAVLHMIKQQAGMDAALNPTQTTGSVATPIQFLQNWLPGAVHIVTAPRTIDDLVGMTVVGSWEDEEIVQRVLEHTSEAQVYGDFTDIPYTSWNLNFERRSVVRFEEGMQIGRLEEARAARAQINSSQEKQAAAQESLEIERNRVGFFGFNGGANRTYGLLNDVDLPNYTNLPNGAGGDSTFASKTYLEITSDLTLAAQTLRTQSNGRVRPERDRCILAIAQESYDALIATTTDFGQSVMDWMAKTYSSWDVIPVPEMDNANGGDSVLYLYATGVSDSGTDDNATFVQAVPTKFKVLGNEAKAKGYEEAYSNATAGILTKRPYAVTRFSGC